MPVLRELANGGFQDPALGDLGYRGKRLAEAGQALGITVKAIARGRDGKFVPAGICWWLNGRSLGQPLPAVEHHLRAFEGALSSSSLPLHSSRSLLAASSASLSRHAAPDAYKQALSERQRHPEQEVAQPVLLGTALQIGRPMRYQNAEDPVVLANGAACHGICLARFRRVDMD